MYFKNVLIDGRQRVRLTYKGITSKDHAPDFVGACIAWALENWDIRDSKVMDYILNTPRG